MGSNYRIATITSHATTPRLLELHVADAPESWQALGFEVADGSALLGGVRVVLGGPGHGITRWTLANIEQSTEEIDGLPTTAACPRPQPSSTTHPNGAIGLDHVVITSPEFDRTARALAEGNMQLRRIRDAGGLRQGFRRLGPAILELVESPAAEDEQGPARFWGLVVTVTDLEALADRLADRLAPIKKAVQPGREIATLRSAAGLGEAVAFMTPEP